MVGPVYMCCVFVRSPECAQLWRERLMNGRELAIWRWRYGSLEIGSWVIGLGFVMDGAMKSKLEIFMFKTVATIKSGNNNHINNVLMLAVITFVGYKRN